MSPSKFYVDVSEQTQGEQIGNAMSVSVIERVLRCSLRALNMIAPSVSDRWESGKALEELQSTKGKFFREVIRHSKLSQDEGRQVIKAMRKSQIPINGILPDKKLHAKPCLRHGRLFIADSGSSLHLVSRKDLTRKEIGAIRRLCPKG